MRRESVRPPQRAEAGGPAAPLGELHFRRLLECLPAGAYTCDRQGLITYYNPQAVEVWGREPALEDPSDRYCGSFKLYSADGRPIAHDRCWMAQALETGRDFNGQEIVIERPDGTRRHALAHATPIRDDDGRIVGAVNVLVDITDRRQAEATLERLYGELQAAHRRKDEFLTVLAHELRNPLAPIVNSLNILRLSDDLSPAAVRIREIMERQVGNLARLVDDLLEISRIASGKYELRSEPVELASIVASAVETSRPAIDAGGHQLAITVATEPIPLVADPMRLAQVIANLLNNAAKYTPQGGQIWLSARREGDEAVIAVRDNGVGIDAATLPRVFDMFTQSDQTRSRAQGGLGIGLTLAKRLVLLHGGRIEANSAGPGRGSEFLVRLPLAHAAPRRAAPSAPQVAAVQSLPSRRILVVDDARDTALILGKLLEKIGQQVFSTHDAASALETARREQPEVIISDIAMPTMDGLELARRLRAEPGMEHVVLVALTGYGHDSDRQRTRDAGFDHHLVKPVSFDALCQLLSALPKRPKIEAEHAG
jgi:signal transduction histidine kinase/CheY-like chemotaxis protein